MCWGWWPSSSLSEKSSTIHRSSTWNWFSAAHHEAEVGTAAPMDAMKSPKNLMRLTRWIWLHWASSKESRKQGKERNEKKKERKRTNEHLKKAKKIKRCKVKDGKNQQNETKQSSKLAGPRTCIYMQASTGLSTNIDHTSSHQAQRFGLLRPLGQLQPAKLGSFG